MIKLLPEGHTDMLTQSVLPVHRTACVRQSEPLWSQDFMPSCLQIFILSGRETEAGGRMH